MSAEPNVEPNAFPARPTLLPPIGAIVRYESPDWGPVRGKVLATDRGIQHGRPRWVALCQDLSEHGAREYWPVAELTWGGR